MFLQGTRTVLTKTASNLMWAATRYGKHMLKGSSQLLFLPDNRRCAKIFPMQEKGKGQT